MIYIFLIITISFAYAVDFWVKLHDSSFSNLKK